MEGEGQPPQTSIPNFAHGYFTKIQTYQYGDQASGRGGCQKLTSPSDPPSLQFILPRPAREQYRDERTSICLYVCEHFQTSPSSLCLLVATNGHGSVLLAALRYVIHVLQGPDLQNIVRQSYDYLTIMPKLRSTYDGRLIYKIPYNEWKAFGRLDSRAKSQYRPRQCS